MVPIDDLRRAFWDVKKKQGLVLAQFFKLFYHGTPFIRKIKSKDGERYVMDTFEGDLYQGIKFDVIVETVGGSRFTNAGDITALDALYAKGEISAAEYIEAYPDDALSNKQKILEILKNKQTERQQIQAMAEQMKQMQAYIAESQKAMDGVKTVLAENKSLKEMLAELYQESMAKITDANAQIEAANQRLIADAKQINELQGDAREFAKALYAQMRASGGGVDAVPQV
jgi:thiamine kinase-like enzyme